MKLLLAARCHWRRPTNSKLKSSTFHENEIHPPSRPRSGPFTASTASAGLITDPLGFQAPIRDAELTTDTLGQDGPKQLSQPPVNVPAAAQFLASVLVDGKTVRLSDLMLNPEFFAAAHATGPEADALRGELDWLTMTGVIVGFTFEDFDGMDGSDDLRGSDDPDEIFGESGNGIILGGPGNDTLQPQAQLTPFNPSIILGGPGSDNVKAPINGFVFGTTTYLK